MQRLQAYALVHVDELIWLSGSWLSWLCQGQVSGAMKQALALCGTMLTMCQQLPSIADTNCRRSAAHINSMDITGPDPKHSMYATTMWWC